MRGHHHEKTTSWRFFFRSVVLQLVALNPPQRFLKMPRAQGGFLSGAVWPITAIFACCLLVSFTNALHHLELHRSNAPDVTDQSSALEALFNTEWSDEDLQMLQKMMDEQVERFRSQLFEQHKAQLHREKRTILRVPSVTGVTRSPSSQLNVNETLLPSPADLSCFTWNEERFCVLGSSMYRLRNGRIEHFLSGLPIGKGDHVKAHSHDEAVFLAIYNKDSASLRLYLLRSPGWKTLVSVQNVFGNELKDCVFFEDKGALYMALAIHLGPEQNFRDPGMYLAVYKWLGTTMDMVEPPILVSDLRKLVVLKDGDSSRLLLLHGDADVQLFGFNDNAHVMERQAMFSVNLPRVIQVDAFIVASRWCLLFGGTDSTVFFSLEGQKVLELQEVLHNRTTSPVSWSRIQQDNILGGFDAVILIFSTYSAQSPLEFYVSNVTGRFDRTFVSSSWVWTGEPGAALAFLDRASAPAHLYVTVPASEANSTDFVLSGFDIAISESRMNHPQDDPLLKCLSDVDFLINKLNAETVEHVEELKSNMVTVKDDVVINGTVTVTEINSTETPITYGKIQVLFNFTEDFRKPNELNKRLGEMKSSALKLSGDASELLYPNSTTFQGRLTMTGIVTVNQTRVQSASVDELNGRNWTDFTQRAWRYSLPQMMDHDLFIQNVVADNVTVGSRIGMTDPSQWLLGNSDVVIRGLPTFNQLQVGGNIDIGDGTINGVALSDLVLKGSNATIRGTKSFTSMTVNGNVIVTSVNERSFAEWAKGVILQNSEEEQHLTGTVRLEGPVMVDEDFNCSRINGLNVVELAQNLVNRSLNDVVNGSVRFASPLVAHVVHADTINGIRVEELLSTSGNQTIQATLNVDVLHLTGDLECRDINGVDLGDFLYADEHEQTVRGRIRFLSDVDVQHLVMENGTLNDLDVIDLLNPPSLRIDSPVHVTGDWTLGSGELEIFNGTNLKGLRDRFWTKSTDQIMKSKVRMPFDVVIQGNITTGTFQGRKLNGDNFYLTAANETVRDEVIFTRDVVVLGNMTVDQLDKISGNISLQDFADGVVLKEGTFPMAGTKTFEQLIIQGNLKLEETINGQKMPADFALLDKSQALIGIEFDSDVSTTGDVVSLTGDLSVTTVADFNLDDFVEQAVMIDQPEVVIDGNVHFLRHLHTDELTVLDHLNGRHIDDIVKGGVNQTSNDPLQFSQLMVHGKVIFQDSFEATTFNDLKIDDHFSQVVNMTNLTAITGNKTARMLDVDKDVRIRSFNGVPVDLSTILTTTRDQDITGDYVFDHLNASSIELKSINGRNLTDYVRIADSNETQIIEGKLEMKDVTVRGPLTVESRTINGCNLSQYVGLAEVTQFDSFTVDSGSTLILEDPSRSNPELATLIQKALRTDRDQVVGGIVTIRGDAEMSQLNIPHDAELNRLLTGSMLKSVEQNVTGTMEYADTMTIDSLESAGQLNVTNWNGLDVKKMVDRVVLKTGGQTIKATKTFTSNLDVRGNLNVTGSIDGVPVGAMIKTKDGRLPARTHFTSLVIQKELNVTSSLINSVNLTSLLAKRVPLKGNTTIKTNITFNDTVTTDSLTVPSINGLNMSDIVWKTAGPGQVITGRKLLNNTLDIDGDTTVGLLNGRRPEELSAFIVMKDEDTEFDGPLSFSGGLSVMTQVNITKYNGKDLSQQLAPIIANVSSLIPPESKESLEARSLLSSLQKSTAELASFEFFDQTQQVVINFPHGTNVSMRVQHCSIPTRRMSNTSETAAGIVIATHSSDGPSCGLKKPCRCHRSVTLPADVSGQLNTLRMPIRLQEYLDDRQVFGDRVRLLNSRDHLFVLTLETILPGCTGDKLTLAALDPVTFKVSTETAFELNDTVVDVELEQFGSLTYLAVSQTVSGVQIYTFDGRSFTLRQMLETERISAIDLIATKSSLTNSTLFLAVASYGLDTLSTIWVLNGDDKFELLKDIITVGATDVAFTESNGDLYLTIGQDPSSIDPFTDNWTQFRVPAQVLIYSRQTQSFELFQQLDIDRVISLANMDIDGAPFMAVATFRGSVRIYRLIRGQGFQPEQTFKTPGIKSIAGYSIRNETYLVAVTESRAMVYVARLRGFQKPTLSSGLVLT